MAENIKLEIVTPDKIAVAEDAQAVTAPGTMGEFGVLSGHTPFLSSLKIGSIRYVDAGGTERFVFVGGGFVEALPDKVTVLAESAERRREISEERAKAALERAEKRLSSEADDVDFLRAEAALARAMYRLTMCGSIQ